MEPNSYSYLLKNSRKNHASVHTIQVKKRESDYIAPAHIRIDHQFYLCLSTKIEVKVEGACSVLEPGEFIIIPPGKTRSFRGTGGEPHYILIFFSYSGEGYQKIYGKVTPLPESCQTLVKNLLDELSSSYPEREEMLQALGTMILIDLRRQIRSQIERKVPKDERILALEHFMKTNFHRSLGRSELAKVVSLSPSHVGHLFQKMTGKSLIDRLTEVRIDEAKRLLETSTLPTTYIAYEVGFNSYSHFTQLFKRLEGRSPSAYRRGWLNSDLYD